MTVEPSGVAQRRAEIVHNLAQVRGRVASAAAASGRDAAAVTLVAVTKTFPASDARLLVEAGVPDLGENRDQEARPKAAELATDGLTAQWHFVGRLQRNKCRSVAGYAAMVQSVDRPSLVSALDSAVASVGRAPLPVLIQLSVDGDVARGGVVESQDESLAERVLTSPNLRLAGVMAVAPRDWEPDRAFAAVAERSGRLRRLAPEATVVSAGMSGDFEAAIAHGSTMIRLGAKLLGRREQVGYPGR